MKWQRVVFPLLVVYLSFCFAGNIVNASPGPDLIVTSVSGPATGYVKQVISVTYQVENQGDADAGAFTVGLYLSQDNLIATTDRLLKKVIFPDGLLAGQSTETTTKVTIPINLAPGDYYFGAIADVAKQVAESKEGNNKKASAETIQVMRYQAFKKTVVDRKTRLMWQKTDDNTKRDCDDAGTYCDELVLGGYDDWRLPRIDELSTIVDYSQFLPASDDVFGRRSRYYWSSSTSADDPDDAWRVNFGYGYAYWNVKGDAHYVRCVRGGPYWPFDPSDRLQIVDDDTAKDTLTNLVWQRSDDGQKRSWNDALDYCADLILAGKNDWRLPTIEQLQTIIDYTTGDPAISTEVFSAQSGLYWSSSTVTGDPYFEWEWGVSFYDGGAYWLSKFVGGGYVRCARGGPW